MPIKTLFLGDPHTQISNLDQSEDLMRWILDHILSDSNIKRLVILGDQFHTHSIIRSEILNFWDYWLDVFSESIETIVLLGNHDMVNTSNSKIHSLKMFHRIKKENLKIVDSPRVIGNFAFMPYYHNNKEFTEAANNLAKLNTKVLICHATLAGSKFENGFYAPDGVNPDEVNFPLIISGHIHSRQRFGKVIYPGTAMWLTNSDINQEKGIWLVGFDDNGKILTEQFLDTSHVCIPILGFDWKEGDSCPEYPEGSKTTIKLIGSSQWISQQKTLLKGKVSIQTKCTDKAKIQNRKSGNSLEKFILDHFESKLKKDKLLECLKELELA